MATDDPDGLYDEGFRAGYEQARRDAAACRKVNASLPSPRPDVAKRCAEAIEDMAPRDD